MSTVHSLKTLPVYFAAVLRGDKTFEVRKNDRDFQTGDTLILKEFDPSLVRVSPPWPLGHAPENTTPDHDGHTGRGIRTCVSYILHDIEGSFGLAKGFVILGLKGVEEVSISE